MCWWVCGCVNEVCMEFTGCGTGCVGVGWVCIWGCGRVSEFWTSGIVYMINTHYKHEYSVVKPKSALSEFWKNIL